MSSAAGSPSAGARSRGPAPRHEDPAIDEAALIAARRAERALADALDRGADRWARVLAELPDQLRDEPVIGLRRVAMRARACYGPKDSIRDALAPDVTEPLLDALDRLIRALNRLDVQSR